jgi:hypothetical protein
MSKDWYLLNSQNNYTSGFENSVIDDYANDGFDELLNSFQGKNITYYSGVGLLSPISKRVIIQNTTATSQNKTERKILSKLKDYGGDGKIDYKGKVFEAKDGDLEKFSIDGDIYSVTWNTDGTYRGYYKSEGKRYTNVEKIIIEEAGYIPPPKSVPGFPGATKTKPVGGRPRWINPDGDVLEWDKQHGDIERYNKQGNKHKGSYDPETGKKTKEPVPGRKTTKPMLDNPVDYEIVTQKPRIDIPPPDPVIIITFEGVLLIGIILLAPIGL